MALRIQIAEFKFCQYLLGANSPSLMLTKLSCFMVCLEHVITILVQNHILFKPSAYCTSRAYQATFLSMAYQTTLHTPQETILIHFQWYIMSLCYCYSYSL